MVIKLRIWRILGIWEIYECFGFGYYILRIINYTLIIFGKLRFTALPGFGFYIIWLFESWDSYMVLFMEFPIYFNM